MKLYLMARCPFAHRAVMALVEKSLAFERVFYTPQTRPKELDAVSKNAKSPTLFDGDDAVYESAVVLEYLEDKYPASPLFPAGPKGRADVRLVIARINDELAPKFGAVAGAALSPSRDEAKVAEASQVFLDALGPWNERLAGRTYLVGDALSLADITLYTIFPALEHLAGAKIPADLAHLVAWRDRLASRPSGAPPVAPS